MRAPAGTGLGQDCAADATALGPVPATGGAGRLPSEGTAPGQGAATAELPPEALAQAARGLVSTTVDMGPEPLGDLVAAGGAPGARLWHSEGEVLVGLGQALRLPLVGGLAAPDGPALVREVLEGIRRDDPLGLPGTGPVAMGALPYDPAEPGWLYVPRLVVGRREGRAWATLTRPASSAGGRDERRARGQAQAELALAVQAGQPEEPPDSFSLSAALAHSQWKELVSRAIGEAESGALTKVVVARKVDVVANRAFSLTDALRRLVALYPTCTVFRFGGFIGASPETLLRRRGLDVYSLPLAGTVPRSGDPTADDALVNGLLSSTKDRLEHQVVVDAIASTLAPWCTQLEVPEAPSALTLRNVSHLGTLLHGALEPRGAPTALEVVARLQPTPAVGGVPTAAALAWQRANEGFRRGLYAGPVGWVDARGDGAWVVGLRSADIRGPRASLYAGAGIVPGSDPDAELAETQLKLQALLAALVRP